MKTVKQVSADFSEQLSTIYDVNEVNSLCMMVLENIVNISSARIKAFPETEIPTPDNEIIANILTRLATGEPIQYILGHTEFYGLTFKVNPSVLIPRPETEELVDWIISSVGGSELAFGKFLDIGTGSGCIPISLKKNLRGAEVSAIDISPEALQTAKENAELNKVDINFIQDDILNPESDILNSKFEIIISNPPYVTLEDKKLMQANVTDFEPHTALFVPEDDPLIFYKAIADFAANHLEKGGMLFFEINESYGKQIVEILSDKIFTDIELRKDMSGKDRMVKATK
ncbi:peptide chain release factor N(5)-glutamine methyltransferase [Mucilaginibacter sp. BT774]|uniref:peptide chain release factor N(5)-glutamine methyltransferase n=1 Tax=Mucilaginibacter sp. BT774 TaxID=3062276 RepID=UPI002676057D|nr:peptide chain release factor N(5)-glutamine methyltransferase [Mucilaginibacter sp. BT774]MDO3625477.1 peptide chain release factor N(5)-glutamine methyltransferase [Mucilaginibacter sp. BT774]